MMAHAASPPPQKPPPSAEDEAVLRRNHQPPQPSGKPRTSLPYLNSVTGDAELDLEHTIIAYVENIGI